ncbi:hypothetical protein N7533_006576 [Penicillium manginii]|uniref:uncharacterized protein n=1 Tax=Penicillium manginii TaxID=203109 RepID=UPI002547FB05|nr:uncharacterized protein N7533_006576 [Penicillium manginii]KAJ5749548.1 hypothetical protein N7533_006576 [Penicillium manginii]
MKIRSGRGICGKDGSLQRCSRCKVMVYCGREHQVAHFPEHKSTCKVIQKAETAQEEAKQMLRKSSSSDPFIHRTHHFGPEIRSYILHRSPLVRVILEINTREAVEKQLEHTMETLRLCPNDNLGAHKTVPPIMILLNQDRECYAFLNLKSWVLVFSGSFRDWSDPGLPRFDAENADVFEPVNMFLSSNIGICLTVPLFLLKLKSFLDLNPVEAQNEAHLSTDPIGASPEFFISLQVAVTRSRSFLSTPNLTDQTTRLGIVSKLHLQLNVLFNEINRVRPNFWSAFLNPRAYLERPLIFTNGGFYLIEETQAVPRL